MIGDEAYEASLIDKETGEKLVKCCKCSTMIQLRIADKRKTCISCLGKLESPEKRKKAKEAARKRGAV